MHVVKIGATWCNACLVMRPRWAEIEKELPWLKTYYLDYDDNEKEISDLGLDSDRLPIFLFYDEENKLLETLTGEISKKTILETIKKYEKK